MHDHDSQHHHAHSVPDTPEKMLALLNHLKEHNEEHTDELKALTDALMAAEKTDAANKLSEAVYSYNKGNELMAEAIDLLK